MPVSFDNQRIKTSAEFKQVFDFGSKVVRAPFVVFLKKNHKKHTRLGLVVSKKIGNAVVRNKIKRRLREVFRDVINKKCLLNHEGFDVVVIARNRAKKSTYTQLHDGFVGTIRSNKENIAV